MRIDMYTLFRTKQAEITWPDLCPAVVTVAAVVDAAVDVGPVAGLGLLVEDEVVPALPLQHLVAAVSLLPAVVVEPGVPWVGHEVADVGLNTAQVDRVVLFAGFSGRQAEAGERQRDELHCSRLTVLRRRSSCTLIPSILNRSILPSVFSNKYYTYLFPIMYDARVKL